MKKTLIALAAFACTAAFAQSTVTLDGVVELGVVKPIGSTGSRLDAANGASQIRFRGSEDLGGGLKANFFLAQRLSLESGNNDGSANGRPTFQGESTIGLSGGFGSIKMGRSLTALQGPVNATDPWGTLQQGSIAVLTSGYATDPVANADLGGLGRTDAITYNSPSMGGFALGVSLGLKTSAASGTATTQAKNLVSVWGSYAAGPLMIGGGVETNRSDDQVMAVLGTYDFGAFKLGGGLSQIEMASGQEISAWNFMATVPLGVVNLKAGYGVSKQDKAAGGVDAEVDRAKKFGIGLDYLMSKRTLAYVSFGRNSVLTANKSGFDIGLRHSF